jgi:GxxExxY protein
MVYELRKRGLCVTSKETVPIVWDKVRLEKAFEADVVVEGKLIVELKSIEDVPRVFKKQLLTHLRLTDRRLGLLINSGAELIKDGIFRVVNGLEE